jgi:hypothetical protein
MYGLYDTPDITSPIAIRLHPPKMSKIQLVFYISLIELDVRGNRGIDLNAVLKISDSIENAYESVDDKVLGSSETAGRFYTL